VVDELVNLDRRALRRLFPGLRLLGAVRLAFDLRKLAIAALSLGLLQLGWLIADRLLPASAALVTDLFGAAPAAAVEPGPEAWSWERIAGLHWRLSEPIRALTAPLSAFLEPGSSWRTMLRALVCLTWLIVVWSFFGGAIARIVIVQIANTRQTGIAEALRFSLRRASALVLAPCCPVLALVFCAAIVAAFGLLYWVPVVGPALSGALFLLPLVAGLVMALLAAGLVVGWPLMQAAVAAGADDALDAWSRTFNYLNQRIAPFAAVLVLIWLQGLLGLFLVEVIAGGVIRLAHWSLGLTAPAPQMAALFGGGNASVGAAATVMHAFWLGVVRLVARGWIYSFYWTAASLLYLWLRHDVDGTPWEEIEPPGAASSAATNSIATAPHAAHAASAPPAAR
jgi:hypothetical protein